MADKDVTQEAAELNAAEEALKAVVMRPDQRAQIVARKLRDVDAQLADLSVEYAVARKENSHKILEATRELLKYKDALKRQVEGTP